MPYRALFCMQAYNCLTDVLVRDLLATTVHRFNNPAIMSSPAYKYLLGMEDKTCHLEVCSSPGCRGHGAGVGPTRPKAVDNRSLRTAGLSVAGTARVEHAVKAACEDHGAR